MSKTLSLFESPLYVMVKPASSTCNLACSYCYYLEKKNIYKDSNPISRHVLSDAMLEEFTKQYIQSQTMPQILFTWHGGEPLVRPLEFYKKALRYQWKYGAGRQIDNCIQTNGTLLTPEWCKFLKDNNWLVGISIDGPQDFHDKYRRTSSDYPSFSKVMHGIELLNKYGVEWNAMAVVNDYNVKHPLEFYNFFKQIGCRYIQFAPIVERIKHHADGRHLASAMDREEDLPLAEMSVTPAEWGNFLCAVFDEWVRQDVGKYFIQIFDATLANWVGAQPGLCTLAKTCGHASVMEYNGDIYTCDHFVFPEYYLGNIKEKTITEMMYSPVELNFGAAKRESLPQQCRDCKYLFACNGECPKNRFAKTADGQPGLNYLCEGYYRFFDHVAPYMDFMKKELEAKRAPANVMKWVNSSDNQVG